MQTQEEEARNGDCKQLKALLFRMFLGRNFFIKFAIPNSAKSVSKTCAIPAPDMHCGYAQI